MVASLLVERTLKAAEGYLPSSVVAALHLLTQTGSTSEIIDECRDLLNKGKETIFTVTARAAPYLSSIAEKKKESLLSDKRLNRAFDALQQAREHPVDAVVALKSQALDMLRYDRAACRDYVQAEIAADTRSVNDAHRVMEAPAIALVAAKGLAVRAALRANDSLGERAARLSGRACGFLSLLALRASRLDSDYLGRDYIPASAKARMERLAVLLAPPAAVERRTPSPYAYSFHEARASASSATHNVS